MTRALILAIALFAPLPALADAGAFHASDADGNGALSYREFTTLVGIMASRGRRIAVYVQRTGLYGVAFGRVDRNGDGYATPDELIAAQAWVEAYAARHDAAQRATGPGSRLRRH
jgi:hypothetical protein